MTDVVGGLFDDDDIPVMLVSLFDYTITYTNAAFTGLMANPEFEAKIGQDVRTAVEWRTTFDRSALGRAWVAQQVQSGPVDHHLGWTLVASLLETGDEALVTCYFKWPDADALHHHQLVAWRTVAGRAFDAARHLHEYAENALSQARRQMDVLSRVMVLSGKASQVRPVVAVTAAAASRSA